MRLAAAVLLALLLAPTGAAQAQPAPAPAIPFQFVLDRQIVFPITIDGKPAEAWLDSGAGASVVDAAFARQLGLALGAPIKARGVAGDVADVHLSSASLVAGDLAMADRRVVVMDLSAVQRIVQRPVQVLLGRDVFDQAVVDIDFAARRIRLVPRDAFAAPAGAPIPLKPSGDLRTIAIRVAGVDMPAVFDLGNAGGLLLDADFAEHYAFLAGRRVSTELGVGADGPREQGQATLDAVEVGGVALDGVPTVTSANLSSRAPANLGLQVLSRFHLVIDFAGDRVWMTPYADARTRPFRKNRAGLMLVPEHGHLVVDHVAKGSPAERGGWKKGDTVTALDGKPIPPDYGATEASLWITGPAGKTHTLTTGDGRTKTLTLADYY